MSTGPVQTRHAPGGGQRSTAQVTQGLPNQRDTARLAVAGNYGRVPLSFESNQGQTDSRVKFLSRGNGYALFLTPTEAVLTLRGPETAARSGLRSSTVGETAKSTSNRGTVLRMKLLGANPAPTATGVEELPGKSNYLIGSDPTQWRTNVPNYSKVRFAGVYPGVDLIYYGNQSQLEYDFVVAPGADPSAITLGFAGADRLEIDAQGDLALETGAGQVRWRKPVIYQQIAGVRQMVDGHYVRKGNEAIGFELASYDPRHALVIDPVLAYSTYLGGSSFELGLAIAVDSDGKAYVTGTTASISFPWTAGAFQTALANASQDAFVAKFDTTQFGMGTRVYATYLGGGFGDVGMSIAVDSSGQAYVAGITFSSNFPVTASAYQDRISPPFDSPNSAFVTKLNAMGTGLQYSTFLGGNGEEAARGIAVDSSGNAYVTGETYSTDFPTLNGFSSSGSGFVTKLNTLASGVASLVYSTYTDGGNLAKAIALDAFGNVYVTGGWTYTGPPVWCAQPYCPGGPAVFVLKINTTLSGSLSRVYATYLDGNGDESGSGIAVDSSVPANVYVTGSTSSIDFPGTMFSTTPATVTPIQGTNGGGTDAFVFKLNGTGTALVYSTYLGGNGMDSGSGIDVDALGNITVTGTTSSVTGFPVPNALQASLSGAADAFVAKINTSGTALVYSTYLGGNFSDNGRGVALDSSGNAYVAGDTNSTNFPTTNFNAFQTSLNGLSGDAFVAKIVDDTPPPAAPTISLNPTSLNFTATAGGGNPSNQTVGISNTGGGTLSWTAGVITGASWLSVSPGAGTNSGTLTVSVNIAGLAASNYSGSIEVAGAGATNTPQTIAVQLTVAPLPPPGSDPSTISELISLVQGLPVFPEGQRIRLLAELRVIQSLTDAGNIPAACSLLNAFVIEVEATARTGSITPAIAEEMINTARAIQAALGCV